MISGKDWTFSRLRVRLGVIEGSKHDDLRLQLEEYGAENLGLGEQLEQAESEIDRLRRENEELRQELTAAV
ncbi:hypothetical protein SBA6_1200020 [Candidatus Sulfopaludibacter sp. SbA6]|nr:hypothetical protein SBA6_1200020 [Candidatus Sulfopaludibacter sp. SbA6]